MRFWILSLWLLLGLLPGQALTQTAAVPGPATDRSQLPTPDNILRELNWARTQPRAVADYLSTRWRPYYTGTNRLLPGETVTIQTNEGLKAVDEAIRYLRQATPLPPLKLHPALNRAATDHVLDMGRTGHTDHIGSDGSETSTRIERYGNWDIAVSENLMFGAPTSREIVLELIIDDGVPDRGHRANIFDREVTLVGIAHGPHPTYGNATVMNFAGNMK